jgi:ribosomal protein S12 methylthiotransferase
VQEERYARFMERAAAISSRRLAARVGQRLLVLVDDVSGDVVLARSAAEAPQIDGVVRIENDIAQLGVGEKTIPWLRAGEWADVEIVAADTYDLTGRLPATRGEAAGGH